MSVVLEKELPKNWIVTDLENISLSLESGSRPKGGVSGIGQGIPSIGGEHLDGDGGFNLQNTRFIPDAFYDKMTKGHVKLNDILIVKDGATTGKISFINQSFPFKKSAVNEHVFILRGIESIIFQQYLFRYLFSGTGQQIIKNRIAGSAQGGINTSFIKNFQIPVPPLNEQKRIVSKIEELFSLVDSAKQSLENVKVHLKQYKNSLLKRAFDYSTLTKFRDVCELMSGKAFKKKEYASHGVRLFQIANVSFGKVIWDSISYLPPNYLQKYPELELKEGDIVMALNRPILNGKIKVGIIGTVDVPSILYQRVGKFITSDIIKKYFFYYLQSPQFIKQLKSSLQGVDQPFINKPKLLDFLIPIPTIKEQKRIVAKIEESFSIIEKNEKLVDSLLLQYSQIKNSILKQAFEGKLVPQDPNDEPAQILLERIQQERKKNGK